MVQTLVETFSRFQLTPERFAPKALILLSVVTVFFEAPAFAQSIRTGESGFYDPAFAIAVDKSSGTVTGYFESSTGWDEAANAPQFSCIFFCPENEGRCLSDTTCAGGEDAHIRGQLKWLPGQSRSGDAEG